MPDKSYGSVMQIQSSKQWSRVVNQADSPVSLNIDNVVTLLQYSLALESKFKKQANLKFSLSSSPSCF